MTVRATVHSTDSRYLEPMQTQFSTSLGCTQCRRTIPVRVVDDSLRSATTLAEVMPATERSLAAVGWRFMAGEVETLDGGIAHLAGLWCPACAPAFESYLVHGRS